MENPPFEDVFPIQDGDFPLLCLITGGYSVHMGVSKNRGTPKWMVKIMENPYENGWFGGTIILGNTHM